MAKGNQERDIKYLNRDFIGFRRDLVKFSQAHHSGVIQDYNEASPTMVILDVQSYIGDVLSYYQDYQFSELRRDTARQIDNVVADAKGLGYRPQGKRAARGRLSFFIEVPAVTTADNITPNDSFCPVLRKGSSVAAGNISFETLDDLVFSGSSLDYPRMVTGSQFDSTTGLPTYFVVKKDVEIVAGKSVTETFTLGDFRQFLQVELTNEDVIEIISVRDSSGFEYVEVDYLAQDTVFDMDVNQDDDNDTVPYVMKLTSVPRRFKSDRDPVTGKTSLIFGSGDGQNFDDELIPNIADLAIPLAGRRTFSSYSIDPQNFIKTRSLGLSPYNTTLTVQYRIGGGSETNVAPKSIDTVTSAQLDFSTNSLDPIAKANVVNSLECLNISPTEGGGPEESISEIKANSAAFFAAQDRVVTREDCIARIQSLPAKFGKPEKVYVKKNPVNPMSLDIHVLTRDVNGYMNYATPNLKRNIKTYVGKYRLLSDGLNILDGSIINLRCKFGVTVSPKSNRTEVLTACLNEVKNYLKTDGRQISQPIVISDMSAKLQALPGVISVYEIVFTNVIGTTLLPGSSTSLSYSLTRFDVTSYRKNEILFCPEGAFFELKYPNVDIIGVAK